MSEMYDQFDARIRGAQKRLRRFHSSRKELKAYFDERPNAAAQALLLGLPEQLEAWRQYALSRFEVDLEDREQREERRWTNLADACEYSLLAIKYDAFDGAVSSMLMLRDTGERGERLARLVCGAFLHALDQIPGMLAATIEAFQKAAPRHTNETGLAEYLTGYLVTHTSLRVHLRLRAGIDERREGDESLFARLLKEYPPEALEAYNETLRTWGDLMDLRTEVARRLEKQDAPTKKTELAEQAGFANREKLLRLAKAARLGPQELEVFKLCVAENTSLTYREIADQLGTSTNQVGVIKHRMKKKILNKLAAGF